MNEAWKNALVSVLATGATVHPRGIPTFELLSMGIREEMIRPVITLQSRGVNYKFMCAEALWILEGSNQLSGLSPWAPSYHNYSDDGITLSGAYGPKVSEQIGYVVETLREDFCSRQAIIGIWREKPRKSKDIPCTLSMQFVIRDNRLHMIVSMRSWDLWMGFVYDTFTFTMIALEVLLRLSMNVELGSLYVNAGSMHLYHKNVVKAQGVLVSLAKKICTLDHTQFNTPDDLRNDLRSTRDGRNNDIKSQFFKELSCLVS